MPCNDHVAAQQQVTWMATPTRLILAIVDTFDTQTRCESPKTMTVASMVTPTRLIPVTVDNCDTQEKCQSPKTMTVTWMLTPTRLIFVTVDTFDSQRSRDGSKTTTIARMAAPTCLIPVTVDNFDTLTHQRSQFCSLPCGILPRGASVADAAIFVALQKFQMQFTYPPNSSNCCADFVTFSRTRNPDIYNVRSLSRNASVKNSKHTKACRCL